MVIVVEGGEEDVRLTGRLVGRLVGRRVGDFATCLIKFYIFQCLVVNRVWCICTVQ